MIITKTQEKAMQNLVYTIIERQHFMGMTQKQYELLRDLVSIGVKIPAEHKREVARLLFKYKFYFSCSNAKHNRAEGQKKGYENVRYLLGELREVNANQEKYRPDLTPKGTDIAEQYIDSGMNPDFAPTIHRLKGEDSDYVWNNIDIIPKWKHDEIDKAKMQGVLIMRDTGEKYEVIGLDVVESKKEFAKKIGVNENVIYNAKPGQVIKINNIILHFQDVIKMPPQEWTKDELLEKLERYSYLKDKYKDNPEQYEKFDRMYRIYYNTAVKKGFIEK
jgi:hypothetical protein